MLCDICKKAEATVHLTQIVENKMLKIELCEACSKAKGIQETTGFSLADLQVGLGAAEEITGSAGAKCLVCGFTQADFKKTGRLGCSTCWETFAEGLSGLLKAMHKSDRHVGKVPSKAAHTLVITERIKDLAGELEKAVHDEKYELAAQLRDQVRELEAKLKAAARGAV
ncbi:MAG: UvrB/UvrC motif-containing protein [Verrucomicrobiota bacterium]